MNTKMIDGLGYSWINVKGPKVKIPERDEKSSALKLEYSENGYIRITFLGD